MHSLLYGLIVKSKVTYFYVCISTWFWEMSEKALAAVWNNQNPLFDCRSLKLFQILSCKALLLWFCVCVYVYVSTYIYI